MGYSPEVVRRARQRLEQAKADREAYYLELATNPQSAAE